MKLVIFKNAESAETAAPYLMSVFLLDEVVPPGNSFLVPIYVEGRTSPGKTTCYVEICGFRLEAETPEGLLAPSSTLLSGLINSARLPTYIFIASRSHLVYPVYTAGDEVFATTPGGPVFRHVELAKVREFISEYLHTMEEIGAADRQETLHVRGVDQNTLGLVRPIFYLKKRVPGEDDFWAPVFLSEDGRSIYTYAASAKRETPVDDGHEVLALLRMVADALIADGRLGDPYDLRPDRLFPPALASLLANLKRQPYDLSFPAAGEATIAPLYRNGKAYVAVEHREDEDRYSIYVGRDPLDLRARVAQDFERRGLVTMPEQVELLVE